MTSALLTAALQAPFAIGHETVTFTDSSRNNRTISTEIWYPATVNGDSAPVASAPSAGFPVVSFGHGFLMVADRYEFLWEALVPEGYIVVLPRTEGNVLPNHGALGLDLAFLIGRMQLEGSTPGSPYFGAVGARSAVGGHSMGGGASVLAASYDLSIDAVFNLAAAETNPSAEAAAALVLQPSLMIAGTNDCVTPLAEHQGLIHAALASSCSTLVEIDGASHCQFAASDFFCNTGEFCSASISRTEQHERTLALLVPWLGAQLRDDGADWIEFGQALRSPNNASVTGSCNPGPLRICEAQANSSGAAGTLGTAGSSSLAANSLQLVASDLPASTVGLFFFADGTTNLPVGNGTLCLGGTVQRLPVEFATPAGVMTHDLDTTAVAAPSGPITAGTTWGFQAWFRDNAAGGSLFNLTEATAVSFVP